MGGVLLSSVGCWPSTIGYPLSASRWARHSDPRRRISVNGGFEINGSKYQLAGRHQTYSIPECKKGAPLRGRLYKRVVFASLKGAMGEKLYSRKQEGSGALRRPGSSRRRACGPWASPVPPAGRAGSERELYMPPVGGSRGAAIKLIARRAIPPPSEPSEPSEPFEPSEPSRPKGVSNGDTTTLGPTGPVKFKNLFTTLSRRLVFINICLIIVMYRDSSLCSE